MLPESRGQPTGARRGSRGGVRTANGRTGVAGDAGTVGGDRPGARAFHEANYTVAAAAARLAEVLADIAAAQGGEDSAPLLGACVRKRDESRNL